MATVELTVDTTKISETTIDDVKLAIERLFKASEEQFQEIKKETWYVRLWNIVTFSKQNEIRMAEQISTLAQAQEALANILVVLSSQTQEISNLVREHADEIDHLYCNDSYLLQRLKDLKNIIYGFNKAMNVATLSSHNKAMLNSCIYYLSLKFGQASSDYQKSYANAVISLLANDDTRTDGAACTEEVLKKTLPKIEPLDDKKCILMCCFEYIYLYRLNKDDFEGDICKDIISMLDVGSQTVKEMERMVIEVENLRGPEGIIEKYKTPVVRSTSDTFTMDLDWEEVCPAEKTELETMHIAEQSYEFSEIKACIKEYTQQEGFPLGESLLPKEPQTKEDEKNLKQIVNSLLKMYWPQKPVPVDMPYPKTIVNITVVPIDNSRKRSCMIFTTYALYYIFSGTVIKFPYEQMSPENVRTDIRQGKGVFYCGDQEICNSNITDALKSFSQEIYRQEPKPMTDLLTPFEKLDVSIRIGYFRTIANILKEEKYPLADLYQLVDANSFSDYWPQISAGIDSPVEDELDAWKKMIPYPNEEFLCQKLLEDLCCTQLWTRFWAKKGRGISVLDEEYYAKLISDEEVINEVKSRVIQAQEESFAAITDQEENSSQERNEKINAILYNYECAADTAEQAGYVDIQQELDAIVSKLKERAVKSDTEEDDAKDCAQTEDELENKRKAARKVVYGFVASTTATGAVPIPFADMPLLVGQQVAMLTALAQTFEIPMGKEALKSLVLGALSVSGASIVGKTVVSSFFKLIPGAGTVAGGAVSAGTAGILTLAMGNAATEFFSSIQKGELSLEDVSQKKGKELFGSVFYAQLTAVAKDQKQESSDTANHD